MTIRVAIADDHSLVRQGLRRYLELADGIEVVGEASNGKELLTLVGEATPDIALVDIRMPEMDGLEAARLIRDQHPNVGVIMLTAYDDRQFVVEAVRSGARGYVLKEAADAELVEAVRAAADGRTYLNPALGARLAAIPTEQNGPPDGLSEREIEILRLIALGHTNTEIGDRLFLSVRTVESHRAHIQQKLGRTSRAELVQYALSHDLVQP